jgi:hypothetical protein
MSNRSDLTSASSPDPRSNRLGRVSPADEILGRDRCRFTVTYGGLRRLLASKESLPLLKRLLLTDTAVTKEQKVQAADLRPGLEVK